MTEIVRDVLMAVLNRVVFSDSDHSAAEGSRALANLDRPLAVLEQVLGSRQWLVGERLTVAGLNVASVASLVRLGEIPLAATPCVEEWLDRCPGRPACNWQAQRLPRGLPRPPQMAS